MGLTKPTADAYRIQTPVDNAFGPAEFYVCAWVNWAQFLASMTVFQSYNSGTRGSWLFSTGPDVRLGYRSTAGNKFVVGPTHGLSLGEWGWWGAGVDAAGTIVISSGNSGVLSETTAADVAPATTGSVLAPTLFHQSDGTANHARATLADFRFYNRLLSANERLAIYHGDGRDGIVNGLVSRLPLLDAAPGVDTDATVPVDVVNPARSWAVIGAGNACTWEEAPYPLRRRS